jgi:hypothetical protein
MYGLVIGTDNVYNSRSEAEQIGSSIGTGIGMMLILTIWVFGVVGFLVIGLFLKKPTIESAVISETVNTHDNLNVSHLEMRVEGLIPNTDNANRIYSPSEESTIVAQSKEYPTYKSNNNKFVFGGIIVVIFLLGILFLFKQEKTYNSGLIETTSKKTNREASTVIFTPPNNILSDEALTTTEVQSVTFDTPNLYKENTAILSEQQIKETIEQFINAQVSNDFNSISTFFSDNVNRYYGLANPTTEELKNLIAQRAFSVSDLKMEIRNINIERRIEDMKVLLFLDVRFFEEESQKPIERENVANTIVLDKMGKIQSVY